MSIVRGGGDPTDLLSTVLTIAKSLAPPVALLAIKELLDDNLVTPKPVKSASPKKSSSTKKSASPKKSVSVGGARTNSR